MEDFDPEEQKEIIAKLEEEVESWKAKYKALEIKKRESDLSLNKIKTEINSLRSMDKLWKDAAKTVYLNLKDTKALYDAQIDQIIDGMTAVDKTSVRIADNRGNSVDGDAVDEEDEEDV